MTSHLRTPRATDLRARACMADERAWAPFEGVLGAQRASTAIELEHVRHEHAGASTVALQPGGAEIGVS